MPREFMENVEGVHLMWGEHTLCGDAFDIESEDPSLAMRPTSARVVTCARCIAVIVACRGVRTKALQS